MKDADAIVETYVGPEVLARLARPTGTASGLPGAVYTSEEFARLENERLFARSWMCAGFGHEIPAPGDAMPRAVAGVPILFVRNRTGTVRAFHNTCPHRGTQVLAEWQRALQVLRCPNHSWCFDLDGNLTATPHWGGYRKGDQDGFDRERYGLKPVRCTQWHDWLFVNIDGAAPPLDEYMAPFAAHFAAYDLGSLHHCVTMPFEFEANWKLIVENFLEVLHLPGVHQGLNSIAPFQDHDLIIDGPCIGTIISVGLPECWGETALPRFPGISTTERTAKNLALFPNFKLVIGPDHCASMVEFAQGPGRSYQRWDVYFVGDGADAAEYAETRDRLIDFFREVNEEDRAIVEGLQRGRASPAMTGGVFSSVWEPAVHHFHKLVADSLK